MQKEIIGTLFILFIAFSFILFTDFGAGEDVVIGGLATLVAMLQLSDPGVE